MLKRALTWLREKSACPASSADSVDLDGALHDLRHQLNRAKEFHTRLSGEHDRQSKQQLIEKIGRCITRASILANSAMLSSKIKTAAIAPVACSLNEIAQEVIDEIAPIAAGNGVKLIAELGSEVPLVSIDPSIFPSVISNLLDNGVRYTGAGGEVTIKTQCDGETVVLEVRDNGPGISETDRLHLFEKNFRGSTSHGVSGSGIGLYLVSEIVGRHHGQIAMSSGKDGGTVFSIRLPAAAEGAGQNG